MLRLGYFVLWVAAAALAMAWYAEEERDLPRSRGVSFAGADPGRGGSAIVHTDGWLVLTQNDSGRRGAGRTLWVVRREGILVVMECGDCPDRDYRLCGPGCALRPEVAHGEQLTVMALANGEMLVAWPAAVLPR
jgi:hypothetical protein